MILGGLGPPRRSLVAPRCWPDVLGLRDSRRAVVEVDAP